MLERTKGEQSSLHSKILKEMGITVITEENQYYFWEQALEGVHLDQERNRWTARFVFSEDCPVESLVLLSASKSEQLATADVVIAKNLGDGRLFFFFGDGISFVDEPPPELNSLLEHYDCMDRPDALPRALLLDLGFNQPIFHESLMDPRAFFARYEKAWKDKYQDIGLTPERLE